MNGNGLILPQFAQPKPKIQPGITINIYPDGPDVVMQILSTAILSPDVARETLANLQAAIQKAESFGQLVSQVVHSQAKG